MTFSLRPLSLALALLCAGGNVFAAVDDTAMAPQNADAKAVYWQGHDALKRADFDGAIAHFRALEARLQREEPAAADAAIYWQAYALVQAQQRSEARKTITRLHRDYPQSRWNAEADALLRNDASAPAAGGKVSSAQADADELASVAIDGLLSAPPERALPLLRKVLDGDYTPKVKRRALFVLSQSGDASAVDTLEKVATDARDPALQSEAIRMLGLSGDAKALAVLERMYGTTKSAPARRELLQAFMLADRQDIVLRVARNETDPAQRIEAVQLLGVMGANAELKELYAASKDVDTQRAILSAYGISGDTAALSAVAIAPGDESVRMQAIEGLGIAGGGAELARIYPQLQTSALRQAAVHGLMIGGDSTALLGLYRVEKDPETKKHMLRTLGLMGDDAAIDAIEAALQK